MNTYQEIAKGLQAGMVTHRRHIHAHPELGFHEKETSNYIVETLKRLGISHTRSKNGYGVAAHIPGGSGKRIGFRADMDALPIQEVNDVPYRSQVPGVSHACGHDGHTAVLLGLAEALQVRPELAPGDVTLLFQPAEECLPGGAKVLVEEGFAEGLHNIFAMHFQGQTEVGSFLTMPGAIMANADSFLITLRGRGGHAADPDLAHDALLAACNAVCALQNIVPRFLSPLEKAVLTVSGLQSGNEAFNVIQEEAVLRGTVRTFSREARVAVEQYMHQVLGGVCQTFQTTYEMDYVKGTPAVINDEGCTALTMRAVREAGYEAVLTKPDFGGEDFAYYLERVPGCFLYAGCGDAKNGICSPVHTNTFDIADQAFSAALAALLAILRMAAA